MDSYEIPEELVSSPEKRLVKTLITQKPRNTSFLVTSLILLFIILVTQIYWMDFASLAEYLPAVNQKIFYQGQWWRVFTAILIHSDLAHLLSNLYMLSIFSFFVYGYFGFKVYPLFTFLGASLVNLISVATYPQEVRLLGASGLVYLLGGFWLSLYLFIQRQYTISSRIMRVLGIALMVFFPTSFEATTSYRTHFIGFIIGVAMGFFYFFKNKQSIQEYEVYKVFN